MGRSIGPWLFRVVFLSSSACRTRQPLQSYPPTPSLLLEKIYTLPQGKTLRLTRTYELRQRPPESARKILEGGHTDTHTYTHRTRGSTRKILEPSWSHRVDLVISCFPLLIL